MWASAFPSADGLGSLTDTAVFMGWSWWMQIFFNDWSKSTLNGIAVHFPWSFGLSIIDWMCFLLKYDQVQVVNILSNMWCGVLSSGPGLTTTVLKSENLWLSSWGPHDTRSINVPHRTREWGRSLDPHPGFQSLLLHLSLCRGWTFPHKTVMGSHILSL